MKTKRVVVFLKKMIQKKKKINNVLKNNSLSKATRKNILKLYFKNLIDKNKDFRSS